MKKLLLFPVLASTLFLLGCASGVSKGEAFPAMYAEKPISIVVLPAINNSTAADAPYLYSSTINEPLSNAGFYVLPISITDQFLINEGLTEGSQIQNIPPQKFAEIFGADAVLYVTIEKWDTVYYVVGGHVEVGMAFEMKSCKTGEVLWGVKRQLVVDTSSDAGNAYLSLVLTAIKTATQDYVPIAQQVNLIALQHVPYGKYHSQYNQDQGNIVPGDSLLTW